MNFMLLDTAHFVFAAISNTNMVAKQPSEMTASLLTPLNEGSSNSVW
jgi:hypothetical protein